MLNAGIGSSMDSIDEDVIQALDINEDDIVNDEEDFDDVEEIIIGDVEPFAPHFDLNVDNQVLPEETNEYIHTLEYRTQQLEQELEECDDLLKYNVHDNKTQPSQSLVPYDDMKELEELAAEKGLTVEELKQQLLRQLDEDDFDDEEVDTGYEEIQQLQLELADARNDVGQLVEEIDQELLEFLKKHENKDSEEPLAIEDGKKLSETEDKEQHSTKDKMPAIVDSNAQMDADETEGFSAGPLVLPSTLTDMKQFIHQQLRLTDENIGEREKKFKESLESQRHAEEKQLLKNEQQRKAFLHQFREEEAMLIERKKQEERKIEEEMKNKEGELEEEYRSHQVHIESLIQDYESEKHLYETTCKEIQERTVDRRRNAAIEIQRRYKGFRTRRQMRAHILELDERREVRQKEKYELRVMEVQYEINFKAEQAEKEKEEQKRREKDERMKKEEEEKQKELEKQKQEEAKRIAQEIKLEEERKQKEELEAEKRRQKEKEEERKLEEKKKKEEEKLRKEEEKKRKEEEKRLKREQEKKRKEEEKQKQEDEKRLKEEEKKQKIQAEKKQKEEEKRAQQEKRQREIEAKKEKEIQDRIQNASDGQNALSLDYNDKTLTSKSDVTLNELGQNGRECNENKPIMEEECVTSNELKNQGSHRKNLNSSENEKTQVEVEIELADQNCPIKSSFEPKTLAKKKNVENNVLQEHSLIHEVISQSSDKLHPAAKKTSFDYISSSSTAIKVQSPEISEAMKVTAQAGSQDMSVSSQIKAAPVANQVYKPDPIEQLRLEWIKHCLPWSKVSNEPWKLNQQLSGKVSKRPSSAKRFPPLSEAAVLEAAQAESLRQVSSVKLSDLPGCSLSTLSHCWSLRYLTITNSNLVYLDGLSACKHLMYLNAENNKIEYVDLKDLGALQCIQLSSNQLTGTTGFDGCINLRWLDLSRNKIRRISGLGTMRRLHTLNLSHNQLTSVDGIDQAVTLQELDMSHNFLQAFERAEKLCLLTHLNLASNNLLQPPVLKNQVLLQWLDLTENSLQSLTKLSRYWLPLLRDLRCGSNRIDFLDGLERAISLMNLDVSDNQISDLESLKSGLTHSHNLQNFTVQGNPVVDVYASEYRDIVLHTVPDLQFINSKPVVANESQTIKSMSEDSLLQLYQTQIRLHQKLKEQFEYQMKSFLAIKMSTAEEDLCSTIFSYCDTSFKMASEHRSAHEFGDIGVAKTISPFESVDGTFRIPSYGLSDSPSVDNNITKSANLDETRNLKETFDSCLPPSKFSQENLKAEGLRNVNGKNIRESVEDFYKPPRSLQSSHQDSKILNGFTASKVTGENEFKSNNSVHSQKIVAVDSDSDDDDGSFVDVTKDFESNDSEKKFVHSKIPYPSPSLVDNYLNEKDKFLMALESGSTDPAKSCRPSPRSSLMSTVSFSGVYPKTHMKACNEIMNSSAVHEKRNFMETANHSMTAKDKFNALFSVEVTEAESNNVPSQKDKMNGKDCEDENKNAPFSKACDSKMTPNVKADVVGSHLAALDREKSHGNEFGLDISLDSDFDLDNLDFDLEKYLDMGELDEFLEKGWRPTDSPQIPQSNYPVLGRIQDANGSNNSREHVGKKVASVPPPNPQSAWRDSPMFDMRHAPQPPPIPSMPNPSPSPSSVASAAETLGGGSIKSKRDEIAEEWGFKDSRTAQMMMARAKKMKYNAERRRKLNKLDPHQRYQLFRKLEESGKIQHVRPPPAKVLPRKEYFQAREEEAQRQEIERQVEERSRVHRTFEWVHTQVGDHTVSTSRINPMPAPIYSNNDGAYSRPSDPSHNANRKMKSPGSGCSDSASVIRDNFHQQARRLSVDEAFSSQSPVLPPIKINSAPSHHKNERMSWRDNPMERSAGWGGGKKRSGR